MKISERSIPFLKYLKWKGSLHKKPGFSKDGDFLFCTPYDQTHQFLNTLNAIHKLSMGWGGIAEKYAAMPIDLPSGEFIQALERSKKSFEKILVDYAKDRRFTGVLIGPTRQTAFLYDFQNVDALFEYDPNTGEMFLRKTSSPPKIHIANSLSSERNATHCRHTWIRGRAFIL